jgi:integration host factor subunit beta
MSPGGGSLGATMTKSQLISLISRKAPHVPPKRAEAIVNAVFECMTEALRAGERIELRGFGCFAVKSRPARLGRNPKTGALVPLPKRAAISFSAGKELCERLNPTRSLPQRPGAPQGVLFSRAEPYLGSGGEQAPRI